jgi:hypothetical protein
MKKSMELSQKNRAWKDKNKLVLLTSFPSNVEYMSFPVDEMIDLTGSADPLVISPVASSMNVQKPTKTSPRLVAIFRVLDW